MTPGEWLICTVLVWHVGALAIVVGNLVAFAGGRSNRLKQEVWPRVSVLIPARNEADNLKRLLPSLTAQNYPDVEYIVLDDASEDATWDVLATHSDDRLHPIRGDGPPAGWVGKVHALYQATRDATGEVFVFLDADAELSDANALTRLVERWCAAGGNGSALTGLPLYRDRGAGALLTSLVPFAVLSALPVSLVPRTRNPAIGALNGQIWMLGAIDYRRLEPHLALKDAVLEDVMIGRLLKRQGIRLHFGDLKHEVNVRMYSTFSEAWNGFRKNAYLIAGGTPLRFTLFFLLYVFVWVLPTILVLAWLAGGLPFGWIPILTLTLVKGLIDWSGRFPFRLALLAPASLALGAALQIGSAWAHARGTVAWKGRVV